MTPYHAGQLTWLVYIIGAILGGRGAISSPEEHDLIDGELAARVFQLMSLNDAVINQVCYLTSINWLEMLILLFYFIYLLFVSSGYQQGPNLVHQGLLGSIVRDLFKNESILNKRKTKKRIRMKRYKKKRITTIEWIISKWIIKVNNEVIIKKRYTYQFEERDLLDQSRHWSFSWNWYLDSWQKYLFWISSIIIIIIIIMLFFFIIIIYFNCFLWVGI